jgi:hypothetical protein
MVKWINRTGSIFLIFVKTGRLAAGFVIPAHTTSVDAVKNSE